MNADTRSNRFYLIPLSLGFSVVRLLYLVITRTTRERERARNKQYASQYQEAGTGDGANNMRRCLASHLDRGAFHMLLSLDVMYLCR